MAIDDGGFGTGSGDDAGTSREFNFWQSGSSGGFSGESEGELDKFIRSTGKAKNALKELQSMMTGEGKDRITTFTTSLKKLNTQLEQTVGHLREAKDLGFPEINAGGGGSAGGAPNGGVFRMPDQDRLQQQHARDISGGGAQEPWAVSPRTPVGPGGPGVNLIGAGVAGGFGARMAGAGRAAMRGLRPAMIAGGAALSAGYAGGQVMESRRDAAEYMQLLAAEQATFEGGTRGSYLAQHGQAFRQGGFADTGEFASAEGVFRGMGLGRGSETHSRMLQDVGGLLHARPDADPGQLASVAGSLQHGQVAQGLRMRGITQFDQSTPEQMRSILRAAAGGQEVTSELLSITRPGTVLYANLLSLLGNDEQLVNEVLEFGRADAQGRARGVDVTTAAGAEDVFGPTGIRSRREREGAREDRTTVSRADSISNAFGSMEESALNWAETIEGGLGPWRDMLESLGVFGTAVKNLATGPLASVAAGLAGLKWALTGKVFGATAGGGLLGKLGIGGGVAAGSVLGPILAALGITVGSGEAGGRMLQSESRGMRVAGSALSNVNPGARLWSQGRAFFSSEEEGIWARLQDAEDQMNPFTEPAGGPLDDIVPIDAIKGADHDGAEWRRPLTFNGVQEHVRRAGNYINKMFGPFPGGIGGREARPNNKDSDHPRGLALDFMTNRNKSLGDRVSNFLTRNARHFGVKYVIWKQRINSLDGRGWRQMEDRGSPTANHMDHPHVSFHSDPGNAASADPGEGLWGDDGAEDREQTLSRGAPGGQGGAWGGSRDELEVFNAFFGGAFGTGSPQEQDDSPGGMFVDEPGDFGEYAGDFSGDPADVAKVAARAGWRGNDLVTAVAVALAESRGNPRADAPGSEDSRGLWQINSVHHGRFDPNRLYDPQYNANAAYALWTNRPNWADWSVHPNSANYTPRNSYQSFMNTAKEAVASLQGAQDHFGSTVEPAGGLSTDVVPGGGSSTPSAAPVGMVPPTTAGSRGAGVTQVNVNFKIERATYDEAEKFASWVMEITNRKQGLARVGSR